MASLRECIDAALSTGKITKEDADNLSERVKFYENEFKVSEHLSPQQALQQAEKKALSDVQFEKALKLRQTYIQASKLSRAIQNVSAHPKGKRTGLMSLLVKDVTGEAGYSNIDNRGHAILANYHSHFAEAMEKYRTKNLGFSQDTQGLRNLVREVFGDSTGDGAASAMSKVWSDVAEIARQRFNRAGGAIAKREDWGMPQHHDALRVGRTSKAEWIDEITPMLDVKKMTDDTGQAMSESQLRSVLDGVYDRIVTNGLVDLAPGKIRGKKLSNRHRDHRVLHFKDADSWLSYHDRYGNQDIYTTLTDHLSKMAHDTARLEVLGPNPDATYQYLRDLTLKDGEKGLKLAFLDSVYSVVSGKADDTASTRLADFTQSARNLLVSAKLGGAFLSAISDLAFLRQTSKFNGIPAAKVYRRQLSLMNPANSEDRLQAVKMQLTADAWVNRALAANRFTEVTGAGFSAKVADATMRASMLSAWTDAGRKAFGMEFHSFIADNVGKSFDDLPDPIANTFKRYGIDSDDWETMRKAPILKHKGVRFFSPENLSKSGEHTNLVTKIQEMILTETDFAVPTPDSRVRAITTAGRQRGSLVGEISRSAFMFKSFPITVIATHLYRGAMQGGTANKLKYLASISIATTVLGAISLQSKEVARGKDPRNMNDSKFWAAAYAQGGGAGIYGDFLFSDANRFGGGAVMSMAGPMVGLTNDVGKLTLGNVQQVIKGEDAKLGADMVDFARRYTPGGSLWYLRLAYEREVIDQLQKQVDPKAASKFRRIQSRRKKDYNQSYWWKPGDTSPQRPPNIDAVGG